MVSLGPILQYLNKQKVGYCDLLLIKFKNSHFCTIGEVIFNKKSACGILNNL
jgi:hypothetical protein